jgi:hypothetical protein
MAQRFIMRIELSPAAKKQLTTLSDRHGMTQVSMMSRLVEFFAAQDEMIQGAMMRHFPSDIEGDVARLILEKMASKKGARHQ